MPVESAVRRAELGASPHGDDGAVLRHAAGDAGESPWVTEILGVHADDARRLVVLEELEHVGARDVGTVAQ